MIDTADALEIMAIVAACHYRTAPRLDDEQAAVATARTWVDLFEGWDFSRDELIAAVKSRAKICPDAPEPADIIRVARAKRNEALERAGTTRHEAYHDLDTDDPDRDNAAPDLGPYPHEWTPDQRQAAYWFAIRLHAMPTTEASWRAVAQQLAEHQEARETQGTP